MNHLVEKNSKPNVLIYGAGFGGQELLQHFINKNEYNVVGFIDDTTIDELVMGLHVYPPSMIDELIKLHHIKIIVLAIPSLNEFRRYEIYEFLAQFNISILTLPNLTDILLNKSSVVQTNPISPEYLLNRSSVKPIDNLLSKNITNRTVLITGAGGSIGSEIARQVIKLQPKHLVLLDISEFSLYNIDSELTALSDIKVSAIIGSVLDTIKLNHIFSNYNIDTVYHAAAYKHVPIVEQNPFVGMLNNFIGTFNCVRIAVNHQVETFVLISTDKAVRPTNVMGCSKRMSELACQAMSDSSEKTKISMVRFGNVLGSSGSVIPLFARQIQEGGPITVTHPEITRYFMTIPEAAQLVIQAGAMGMSGEVFLLDMGEPVRIDDLARQMIRLSGLKVKNSPTDTGIEIVYSGLRPGEKLYEELLISGDNLEQTQHPKIIKAHENKHELGKLQKFEKELLEAYITNNITWLIEQLEYFVDGYQKSNFIQGESNSHLNKPSP